VFYQQRVIPHPVDVAKLVPRDAYGGGK
jgi:hypothetical protein